MKNYLFIINQAPYRGSNLQEFLDMILITGAFDQKVSVLLLDEGVFSLKKNQKVKNSSHNETASVFKALEIYDINHIYVELESLQQRGLEATDLLLSVQEIDREAISSLLNQQHIIVNQ